MKLVKKISIVVAGMVFAALLAETLQKLLHFPGGWYLGFVIWGVIVTIFLFLSYVRTRGVNKSP